jgi:broad specificity phosphatase PhoE
MRLILVRHGNTFEPGEKVLWVGSRTDLPLVVKGLEQAQAIGNALAKADIKPAAILTGPLRRTWETATIIAEIIHFPKESIVIDERLREIDYGVWEGKSSDEIRALYGEKELLDWDKHNRWPALAGWTPTEATIAEGVMALMSQLLDNYTASDTVCIVSSNGIFRVLGRKLAPTSAQIKMSTGNISVIDFGPASRIERSVWNIAPGAFSAQSS